MVDNSAKVKASYNVAKLYFINLDMRKDRLEHMVRQLKHCPWPVERIPAVRLEQSPESLGIRVIPRLKGHQHFVGIWMSHRQALEAALATGSKGVFVILEDDVRIDRRFWADGLRFRAPLPKNWEIVLLSPRHRRPPGHPAETRRKWIRKPFGSLPTDLHSVRADFITTGAHFAIFRDLKTIRKVLDTMDSCEAVYDVDLFYIKEFRTFGIHHDLISTAHLGSDHG